jgi:hypothetical protein
MVSSLGRREDGGVAGPHDAPKTVFLAITEAVPRAQPYNSRTSYHDHPQDTTSSHHQNTMASEAPPPMDAHALAHDAPQADAGDATQKPVKRSWR